MRAFHQVIRLHRRAGGRSKLLTSAALLTGTVLTAGGLVGVLAVTALPAYADVTTNTYTVGSPSNAVTDVTAAPGSVAVSTSTDFEVSFTVSPALSGGGADWVNVVPSTALGSTPSDIDVVGSSCVQSGTNGGAYSATGLTVDLSGSCNLASGTKAEVYFQADAPVATGSFTFKVTTSDNSSPGTSNTVTVGAAGPVLTAASYTLGSNTTYSISDATVSGLSAGGTSLVLTAQNTHGAGTIAFLGAGYSVTYTPSGGSATTDTVTNVSAAGASVTLTLTTALANGDTYEVTATGENPTGTGSANRVVAAPGNGTQQTTNSIDFGSSVTSASVDASTSAAGATATYTVGFKATTAAASGGDIYLTESAGPTNFSTVTGIEVIDTTQNWHFVATGFVLNNGSATIPLTDNINAGDSISIIIVGVTNPASAGTIADFTVATSGDPVQANAPAYLIGASTSPGPTVTVNPNTAGSLATYTIANITASATLTAGVGTIKLVAPSGTDFPNNPAYFSITDSTSSSGSGTASAALTGGGTSTVTFTVPNTVNSGDVLTITVADVVNPSTSSTTDSITLEGAVTSLASTATTTTTAPPPTTTTTRPPVKKKVIVPKIKDVTPLADVSKKHVVHIKLKCAAAACKGTVTLTDVTTVVGVQAYKLKAGKTGIVIVHLTAKGVKFLAGAKHHTIKVTAKVTVSGGKTVKEKTALVA